MDFRKTEINDVDRILEIIIQAQEYFKLRDIDQWQDGYPNRDSILSDMEKGDSFVILEGDKIVGTTAISFSVEATYNKIFQGQWLDDIEYAVVHRVAFDNSFKGKGMGTEVFNYAEKLCREKNIFSIRVDTHRDNIAMQRLIEKNDFSYCGIIYLDDGAERLAYEKIIK